MTDSRFVTKAVQGPTGVAGVDRCTYLSGDNEIEFGPHVVGSFTVDVVLISMTLKCCHEGVGDGKNSSRSGCFRFAKLKLVLFALERPAYAECSLVKVDIAPLQAENLAGPEPEVEAELDRDAETIGRGNGEELGRLLGSK